MRVKIVTPPWAYLGATRKLSDAWGGTEPQAVVSALDCARFYATDIQVSSHHRRPVV